MKVSLIASTYELAAEVLRVLRLNAPDSVQDLSNL